MWPDPFLIFKAVQATLGLLVQRMTDGLVEIWNAIPNPFRMVDAGFRMVTGLTGIVLAAPINGLEMIVIEQLRFARFANRLMKVEDAVRFGFGSLRSGLQTVTLTDEDGIIEWIAQWLARFIWRLYRRVKFLRVLIKVKNEAELIEAYITKFKKFKARSKGIILWVALWSGAFYLGATLLALGILTAFASGQNQRLILSQDSKKMRLRVNSVRKRANLKTGPDK